MTGDARRAVEAQLLSATRPGAVDLLDLFRTLRGVLAGASQELQDRWLAALDDACARAPDAPDVDLPFAFARAASAAGRWATARDRYRESIARSGDHPATWHNLGQAQWQLGDLRAASEALERAQRLAPGDPALRAACAALAAHREACRDRLGCERWSEAGAPDGPVAELSLQLLGEHHAERLLHHQRDPLVARSARLPHLRGLTGAQAWIRAQRQDPAKTPLALLHRDHGLVGFLSWTRTDDAALLCYWVGGDVQRRGYGRRALGLLLELAARRGVARLFALVLAANAASLAALRSQGFETLPVGLRGGHERLVALSRRTVEAEQESAGVLVGLRRLLASHHPHVTLEEAPRAAHSP